MLTSLYCTLNDSVSANLAS